MSLISQTPHWQESKQSKVRIIDNLRLLHPVGFAMTLFENILYQKILV